MKLLKSLHQPDNRENQETYKKWLKKKQMALKRLTFVTRLTY
jgi:hypothetical protein